MSKIHMLRKHREIDVARLTGKVVVFLDALFATTTIVHAFARGVVDVWPARCREDALCLIARVGQLISSRDMSEATGVSAVPTLSCGYLASAAA